MTESREEIMEATFKALCEHGYADLSIQKIADKSDLGKSAIYYHFDNKDDLMLSFLENMTERIEEDYGEMEDPEKRLDYLLDNMLSEEEENWQFQKAFQELRVQSYSNPEFAEQFREADNLVLEQIKGIAKDMGAEEPEKLAELVLSTIEGAISRKTSTEEKEDIEELKKSIKELMNSRP